MSLVKKEKQRKKKYLKVVPGREFTKLAHSVGIPAAKHGVPFGRIKYEVAMAICEKKKIDIPSNIDGLLRDHLGLTEEGYRKKFPDAIKPRGHGWRKKESKTNTGDNSFAIASLAMPEFPKIGRMKPGYINGEVFYKSDEWRKVRYKALVNNGGVCQCCGARASDGAALHVDHVVSRWSDPGRQLDLTNLQVLCDDCNLGKGAWDATDWREHWKSLK